MNGLLLTDWAERGRGEFGAADVARRLWRQDDPESILSRSLFVALADPRVLSGSAQERLEARMELGGPSENAAFARVLDSICAMRREEMFRTMERLDASEPFRQRDLDRVLGGFLERMRTGAAGGE